MTDGTTIDCGNCGESAPADATWCEACGHELGVAPKPACVSCGEREVDVDEGYCLSCGYRQPRERDHLVVAEGPLVAISDRGRRHHHNEDAVALGSLPQREGSQDSGPTGGSVDGGTSSETAESLGTSGAAGAARAVVIVVCDGVSSTPGSAEASAAAAAATRDHVIDGLAAAGSEIDVAALMAEAVAAGQAGAAASPEPDIAPMSDGPPSSTLVAVLARPIPAADGADQDHAEAGGVELTTAWVGDSRAYWIGSDEASKLTGPDHELGGSLVRWLGADSIDPTPDIETVTVTDPGHLVVCTDGLWRYASEPGELAELVGRLTTEGRTGSSLAEALVDHANELGGHDNITVALWSNQQDWPADTSTHSSIASAAATETER